MSQPTQPEIEQVINLADHPDPAESIPTAQRGKVWQHRRQHRPTTAFLRLMWRRIEFRIGFITTGHPVHDAISFHVLIWSAVLAAAFTAGLCYIMNAPIWIAIPAPLVVGAVILKAGLAYLERRVPRPRRRRQR